jgi:N-acyl-L-homoserine lactone synthetase
MQNATAQKIETTDGNELGLSTLLEGYRFRVADDAETFARALDVRREVYVEDFGYDVAVPDEYDSRSWLLVAEHVETGEVVGTMRLMAREFGPVECEEYFELPENVASRKVLELSRFAIVRAHRKTRTFLPIVSVGLFKLAHEFTRLIGAEYLVVCSKAAKIWTYQSLGFGRTGKTTSYAKLNNVEHELLALDFTTFYTDNAGNPFLELFEMELDEIVVPSSAPSLGLVEEPIEAEPFKIAVGA